MNVSLRRSLKTHRKSKESSIKCYESNFLFMKKKFNVKSVITENWISKNVDLVIDTYLNELCRQKKQTREDRKRRKQLGQSRRYSSIHKKE